MSTTITPETIKAALDRNARAVELRPSIGQGTAVTRVTLTDGMSTEVRDGDFVLMTGMSTKYGGDGGGPNPGVLGRGALGSCIAAGYAMWAARLGIPIEEFVVEIQADYDVRGELGVDDSVTPAYSAVRAVISARSSAPRAEVDAWLETAERHSAWLAVFRDPIDVEVERNVTAGDD